jgi:tRNA (adenine57-N1/adenine58-N1)-methyltransferase
VVPRHPGHPDPFTPGDRVLLIDRKGRRYLVTLVDGGEFHYHGGAVAHAALLGRPEGTRVRSAKGSSLLAVRPTAADWTVKAPRGAQVVYPKDQAMIVALADVCPGAVVVEAGAGSGALTCALLRAVGPGGRVVSFELREEHAAVAERNVAERHGGRPANWTLVRGDVLAGLAGHPCDRVVLDLAEPWTVLPAAVGALRAGGIILAYTPTVPQVMRLREALDADPRWGLADTVETLVRGWHVDHLAVRPNHRMVAHTAFLTTARRLADAPVDRDEPATAPESPPPPAAEGP